MSGKQLSVTRQHVSDQNTDQQDGPHDKLSQFVYDLLKSDGRDNGTVDDILSNPQVKKHGILGRLSSGQQSLVTSVVSIMQDRVAQDAKQNADALKQIIIYEREALSNMSRSFAATAKSLYQLPLLGQAKTEKEANSFDHGEFDAASKKPVTPDSGGDSITPPSVWERFLTWGNLIAFTAILLAVLVVKTSVDTASFETQYRLTKENLDQLKVDYENLQLNQQQLTAENKSLAEENAAVKSRLEETQKQQLADNTRHEADLQQQKIALDEAKQTIAKQQATLAQTETSKTSAQTNLNEKISELQQKLAAFHGKESQQDQTYQMWKALAEERKVEISKLQTELLSRASLAGEQNAQSAGTDKTESKFLGFF